MSAFLLAALVGVLHVHHAPSHDSERPFSEVLGAAQLAELDFLVLTEHADAAGPLPAHGRAGLYPRPDGGTLRVLVGAEFATEDGHLLGYGIERAVPAIGRRGRDVIADIHAQGGFAVVPHPFAYGGWRDWEAPFDGLEVHNHAADFRRRLGIRLPLDLVWIAIDRESFARSVLGRPNRELAAWERLRAQGRNVVAFSGADAHQNVSILGWQLDPYLEMFRLVQTVCPDGPLTEAYLWAALRNGRCWIRYLIHEEQADEARAVEFPSGRTELQLDEGERVLEIRTPPALPH
ncbi:MAG: PHP domain-containing protein [Myxococcales bacterium]|nr:PHP domain-containing protein [Myxococcales bacterium]